jgi:acyl-CoA thioesterase
VGGARASVHDVGNPFVDATTLRPAGPGRHGATLDAVWNLRPLPQGGILTAIAVRAMEAELGDDTQQPRTLHTTFVAQVADGDLEVEVEVLRRGRSMSHARAEVRNPGAARGHVTTCVFGAPREGFEFTDLRPPEDIPPPDACVSYRDPPPPGVTDQFDPVAFWEQLLENRVAMGHLWWDPYVPDRAERALWTRFDDPPLLEDGRLDPLGLIVIADTMPGAVGERIGPQERLWFAPSVDLTVHLFGDCRSPWVLAHNRARYAGDGYASADMALWDYGPDLTSEPRLVAYATQLFLFTFPSP